MSMNSVKIFRLLLILLVSSTLIACSGTSDNAAAVSSGTGRVSLLITDAPNLDFDEVNLTVQSVSFLGEHGHQSIILNQERVINLLALQNYSDWLATAVIPAGTYDKIRLHVSQVELVRNVAQGQQPERYITKLPANGKVDLNPRGSFEVVAGGHLMVELDVDAEKSIHIIEKGNGNYSYNFRPVVFVNILNDLTRLVVLDGLVKKRTDNDFRLCLAQVFVAQTDSSNDDGCLRVQVSAKTVIQDEQIDVVTADTIKDGDTVTVLGMASSQKISALHIVEHADISNLGLFAGQASSTVDVNNEFTMETDDSNAVVLPLTSLLVSLVDGSGVRVFDKSGNQVSETNIVASTDVDVFGLAVPDPINASAVKAAFVIIDNTVKADQVSGAIAAINLGDSQLTISVVSDTFSGDVCVDTASTLIFELDVVDGKVVNQEITINELETGMSIAAFGHDDGSACMPVDVVLVQSQPVVVDPGASTLLVSGN